MAIGTDLRTLLLAQAPITSLLATTTSVFTDKADQNAAHPYIVITQLNEDMMKMLSGTTGMRKPEFDIDCVAKRRGAADDVADAVESFIKDYSGAAGGSTIRAVLLNDRAYDKLPIGTASDEFQFITTLNFEVQYE